MSDETSKTMTLEQLAQLAQLQEMFGEEPLHEDLIPYVDNNGPFGPVIRHPLVMAVIFGPMMHKQLNKLYEQKNKAIVRHLEAREFHSYIMQHERPFRVDALQDCVMHGLCGEEYWNCLAYVWTDSENIYQNVEAWRELWTMETEGRHVLMDDKERDALAKMPDLITIWRGVTLREAVGGMSWTTDKAKAMWFARRYSHQSEYKPYLAEGKVAKSKIRAFLQNRSESEIVVMPEDVNIISVTKLPRRKTVALI